MPKKRRDTDAPAARDSVFVDTSAWIALFSRRDQNHAEADRAFRGLIGLKRQLVTTNLVLAELHRLLLYRAGIQAAAAALDKIEASSLVQIVFTDHLHHMSAKKWLIKLSEYRISYTDAVSFAVMEIFRCGSALTYDNHFRIAGFAVAKTFK